MRIIDFHAHLGDVLNQNGANILDKKSIKKKLLIDIISVSEAFSHSMIGSEFTYGLCGGMVTRAERARNAIATLENFEKSAREVDITKSICLPIPPYLTYSDINQVCDDSDRKIIPFTGVDFSSKKDWFGQLKVDVNRGAKGLKLHPIIQKISLTDKRTYEVLDSFQEYNLPVLFHCGVSSYYLGKEKRKEAPHFGQIHYARELVRRYPRISFVAGHSGMFQVDDVIEQLGRFDNVWVETSLQPSSKIKQLLNVFGENRVLFGSDWPFGSRKTAVRILKNVCRKNEALADKLFYKNAEHLLGISSS